MVIDQTMSDFDQTQYQKKTIKELDHIIQTKKIPNALLFTGNDNTGRKEAAFYFAKGCNCLENAVHNCSCKSCRKIDADAHPDMVSIGIKKGKKIISISQIRELGVTLSSKPNEAVFRMVLILNSDKMNMQAQNAVLKLLEEPPENTFFVLIANKVSTLLPTILSRCRKIKFRPLTDPVIEHFLMHDFKIDETLAHITSKTANSNLKKALLYLNIDRDTDSVNWIKRRKWLLKTFAAMIQAAPPGQRLSKGLILSEKICAAPDLVDDSMAVVKTFLRDLAIYRFHPKKIVNLDFFDTFKDINQRTEQHTFLEWMSVFFETEKKLASNCALRLTLDNFFLKIAGNKGTLIYD